MTEMKFATVAEMLAAQAELSRRLSRIQTLEPLYKMVSDEGRFRGSRLSVGSARIDVSDLPETAQTMIREVLLGYVTESYDSMGMLPPTEEDEGIDALPENDDF